MKKCIEFLKNHYLLFSFVTLYVVIPIILILACYFSAHSLEFVSENIITVISGILAYIGTTVLGLVSVWQNKQAFIVNSRLMHLQRSEFEKNKSSIIRFKQEIEFSSYVIAKDFFERCKELPQNFYMLADENYAKNTDKVESIELFFDSLGHELNKIKILKVILSNKNQQKTYTPLKEETKTGFCFDFEQQAYKLSLLLFDEKLSMEKFMAKGNVTIDIVLNVCSKANIRSNLHSTITVDNSTKKIHTILYYYYNDEILNQKEIQN